MCIALKYGVWNVQQPQMSAVNALVSAGYSPLSAMILSSRGMASQADAHNYLRCDASMPDPFLMTDMDLAAGRVGLAMTRGEKIAVFGDYDVDGITSTCLLTAFLRQQGADVVSYIPGRLEEGYGLNPIAIHQLHAEGVKLIITVDCGITAVAEAGDKNRVGIVTFAKNALYVAELSEHGEGVYRAFLDSTELPEAEATNLEEAMYFAESLLDAKENRRIIVVSDGMQTDGDALAAAKVLAATAILAAAAAILAAATARTSILRTSPIF